MWAYALWHFTNASLFACFCFNKRSSNQPLQTREVAFADDLTFTGKLTDIKNFRDELAKIGPKYGYFPKSTKSHLTVKKNCLKDGKTMFTDKNINITADEKIFRGCC